MMIVVTITACSHSAVVVPVALGIVAITIAICVVSKVVVAVGVIVSKIVIINNHTNIPYSCCCC